VPNVLVDAGPLIALFDKDDKHHARARDVLARTRATLVTTWPVVTETWHMLDFSADAQTNLLEWMYRGGARLHQQAEVDLERIIGLTKRYRDRPMDLADASLVLASEQLGLLEIISIDRDFDIYRSGGKRRFANLFFGP
jgi:predicted nucleic acid-binding protein